MAGGLAIAPADVTKDGYQALMNGDKRVIAGFLNNVQVVMSNILPDPLLAAIVHKQSAPVDGDESVR
ncbi:MAG: hypothetical protein EOO62_14900 [Hymenobacter sp.]|nr:MAG: hypothetical protein EOO62_14900 [Hymenobacter sp.]